MQKTHPSASKSPIISIITCVFNSKNVLTKTIHSIINQSYPNIEFIIIDGKSTDGTIELIKKYEDKIFYWISEPDNGLYDAMNKGIKLANGDYLLFINAGDEIYSNETIQKVFENSSGADIYYGETEYVNKNGRSLGVRSAITRHKLPTNLTWKHFNKGMVVCHQSFIVKKNITSKYNLKYKYSSDVDWEINCLKNSADVVNTNLIISKFMIGGMSRKYNLNSLTERYGLLQVHFGFFRNVINHLLIFIRSMIKGTVYLIV